MFEVLAILLDTNDAGVNLDAECIEMTSIDLKCIGRRCLYERIQRCFQGFWRETGFRVRVLVLREATVNIRMSQDEAGPRHVTVEASEGSRQQRKERERTQVLSHGQSSERIRSKQQRLGRDEMRRHGERRSECAGDRGSVLLLARNHEIQVGIDSCTAVTVFVHFRWFVSKSCKSCVGLCP